MKKIYFTVTNDLNYDQRMHRICNSLAANGYTVHLIGLKRKNSPALLPKKFKQKRIRCWFSKGKIFYFEYNFKLFFYLLFKKIDAICAIDLDTIVPCFHISKWKKIPRIYDAHELFTELKEVNRRPFVKKVWTKIEKRWVPKFPLGYTVSDGIAEELNKRYGVKYATIRNIPVLKNIDTKPAEEKFLLYQGAVNEGRGFEYLIPAMQQINARLFICGDGNFMPQLQQLIQENNVAEKIVLKGMMTPDALVQFSQTAYIGIFTPENKGLNQYLALPNKFFEYIHATLPQITVGYPEYKKLNETFHVAVFIENLSPNHIAKTVNQLLNDATTYSQLKENCLKAKTILNWQEEEKKLLYFYSSIFKVE
ncbi:MAG TPA: glycosyltransferase [Chitinophagaceae bacterium]|nr:glycosyltransferase [Chitinophagaceae bacterium]